MTATPSSSPAAGSTSVASLTTITVPVRVSGASRSARNSRAPGTLLPADPAQTASNGSPAGNWASSSPSAAAAESDPAAVRLALAARASASTMPSTTTRARLDVPPMSSPSSLVAVTRLLPGKFRASLSRDFPYPPDRPRPGVRVQVKSNREAAMTGSLILINARVWSPDGAGAG